MGMAGKDITRYILKFTLFYLCILYRKDNLRFFSFLPSSRSANSLFYKLFDGEIKGDHYHIIASNLAEIRSLY